MNRWDWMAVRAYTPAAFALVGAFVLMWVASGLDAGSYAAAIFAPVKWASLAALVFGSLHGGWTTYRLWRAERGEGVLCDCGGLLGPEIDGRYGPYRKCLACRRNVARREYQHLE